MNLATKALKEWGKFVRKEGPGGPGFVWEEDPEIPRPKGGPITTDWMIKHGSDDDDDTEQKRVAPVGIKPSKSEEEPPQKPRIAPEPGVVKPRADTSWQHLAPLAQTREPVKRTIKSMAARLLDRWSTDLKK